MLQVYDTSQDVTRPAKQEDIDSLHAGVQKLGLLRVDLLKMLVSNFPTIAQDIEFGCALRLRLHRDFYRANERPPTKSEMEVAFQAFQSDRGV